MPWPVFPQCPAYGFTSCPDYSDTIVEKGSGFRSVNRNWYYPLHTYTAVPIGEKFEDDIHRVLRFWHAVGGRTGRFLITDYLDFKSSENISEDITVSDQPLLESTDVPGKFQLTKVYRDPEFAYEQQRKIQKPVLGSIVIAEDGIELDEGPDWTLDYQSGLVTFSGLGSPPGVLTWGGEFYVPVMFETRPEFSKTNQQIQSTQFTLRELRLKADGS